jgi:hypothetical protein
LSKIVVSMLDIRSASDVKPRTSAKNTLSCTRAPPCGARSLQRAQMFGFFLDGVYPILRNARA